MGPGRDDVPDGIEPLGVPDERTGHQTFVLALAIAVALLALIFTLGWVVYHRLVEDRPPTVGVGAPSTGTGVEVAGR